MNYRLVHDEHFAGVQAEAYVRLYAENGPEAFYHPGILAVAEQFPLLSVAGVHCLGARQQVQRDPFGTLTLNHDRLLALTGRQTLRANRKE